MRTSIKIIVAIGLLAVGWALALYINKPAKSNAEKSPIAKIKEKEIQTEAAEIKKAVDKDGLKHTIYKMVKEIDQSAVDAVKADLLDSVEKLNIARDQIRQIIVINTSLSIKNQRLERKIGELTTTYVHTDDNFRLTVNVPNDSSISATFDAGYNADLIATQYFKPRYSFMPKWVPINDPVIDVYSNDRRFTNKGLRTFTVKPKPDPIALSFDAVGNYNHFAGPSAGSALKLRVGKITASAGFQYYPDFGKWAPDYNIRLKIVGGN